jgi:hypothetical protein
LSKDNINEGALSKMITESNVCTFLLDIAYEDVETPLADFQNTKFEKEDMRKLVHTLNSACSKANERSLEEKVLDASFDMFWPKLEEKLKMITNEKPKRSEPGRTQKEIVVEILEIVRSMQRKNQMEDFVAQLVAAKMDSTERQKGLTLGIAHYLAGTGIEKDSSSLNPDSIEVAKPRSIDDTIKKYINEGD